MISVLCSCGRRFKAEDHHAGKRTRCPVCGNLLVIGQSVSGTPSIVSDNGQVPSWWFPSGSPPKENTAITSPPARGVSDPDDIQTVIITRKSEGDLSAGVPLSVAAFWKQPWAYMSRHRKRTLAIIAGSLVVGGLGLVIWLQQPGDDQSPPLSPRKPPPSLSTLAEVETRNSKIAVKTTADSKIPDAQPTITETPDPVTLPESPVRPKDIGKGQRGNAPRLQVLVPAYFYPAGSGLKYWQHLMDAAAKVKITAIANPNSGPGEQRIPDYELVIQSAHEKGIRVIGYISTKYGKRPLAEIQDDLKRWIDFYPQIGGFFLDQQSPDPKDVGYYVKIRDLCREKLKNSLVVTNPGTLCSEDYFIQAVSDVTCIYAGFKDFDRFTLPAPLKQYNASRFAALPYKISDARAMRQAISDAVVKQIGYLYISDAPQQNLWSELPTYWDEEVEAISQVN
jgi:hypothetical protein